MIPPKHFCTTRYLISLYPDQTSPSRLPSGIGSIQLRSAYHKPPKPPPAPIEFTFTDCKLTFHAKTFRQIPLEVLRAIVTEIRKPIREMRE